MEETGFDIRVSDVSIFIRLVKSQLVLVLGLNWEVLPAQQSLRKERDCYSTGPWMMAKKQAAVS
jgi:hypothetical protein